VENEKVAACVSLVTSIFIRTRYIQPYLRSCSKYFAFLVMLSVINYWPFTYAVTLRLNHLNDIRCFKFGENV